MSSAKQLLCWLIPALTSTSLLPVISPFPGRELNGFWALAKGHLEVAVVSGNLILSSRLVQDLHCQIQLMSYLSTEHQVARSHYKCGSSNSTWFLHQIATATHDQEVPGRVAGACGMYASKLAAKYCPAWLHTRKPPSWSSS